MWPENRESAGIALFLSHGTGGECHNRIVKLALLALFAFAAPAPFAESFTAEEEVVVQASKSAARPVFLKKDPSSPPSAPVSRPAFRRIVDALATPSLIDWTPAVFTRPPPRA